MEWLIETVCKLSSLHSGGMPFSPIHLAEYRVRVSEDDSRKRYVSMRDEGRTL